MYNRERIIACLATPVFWARIARVLYERWRGRDRVVILADGVRLEVGTGLGQGIWTAIAGLRYEEALTPWLSNLRPGGIVLDLGANIGVYTVHSARKVGPTGKVLAFEAMPANVRKLQRNIELNNVSNVDVRALAAGNHEGTCDFYEGRLENSASLLDAAGGNKISVPMRTVDSVVAEMNLPRLDWVKVDVNGSEPAILEGMRDTIKRFHPGFMFEVNAAAKITEDVLRQAGYIIGVLDPVGQVTEQRAGKERNLFAQFNAAPGRAEGTIK